MMRDRTRYLREAGFLKQRPGSDARALGIGVVKFAVTTKESAGEVLNKAKSVLSVVDEAAIVSEWPDDAQWSALLPTWFVTLCAKPMTKQEAEAWLIRWKQMSAAKRVEAAKKPWSLDNWVFWMRPENREWYWWDGNVIGDVAAEVAVEVDGWPFPWDSLKWLLKASGATAVEQIE